MRLRRRRRRKNRRRLELWEKGATSAMIGENIGRDHSCPMGSTPINLSS